MLFNSKEPGESVKSKGYWLILGKWKWNRKCWSLKCFQLCNPIDYSPPGSSVHRILQARILEWVAISFSEGSSRPRDQTRISCVGGRFLTAYPWKVETNFTEEAARHHLAEPFTYIPLTALHDLLESRQGSYYVPTWHEKLEAEYVRGCCRAPGCEEKQSGPRTSS